MATNFALNVDLANVYRTTESRAEKNLITTIAWGDDVDVDEEGTAGRFLKVRTTRFETLPDGTIAPRPEAGFIRAPRGMEPLDLVIPRDQSKVLKVNFVDVQQGDGAVIESPNGRVVLIDGGDNQLFARYLANRFRGTSLAAPKPIDAIVVTHGDADHFQGLIEIHRSEENKEPQKRLFILPRRVYHNGLVKRPSSRPEKELLGPTREGPDGELFVVELVSNLLDVPDEEMNQPFGWWKEALQSYSDRGDPIEFRRLEKGDDDAFAFLGDEGIDVKVLGPLVKEIGGEPGLKFLGNPPKGPRVRDADEMTSRRFTGHSASHTINGHSIVLHLAYNRFHFLFAGDLNEEAEEALLREQANLQAEVFKVPHHGSADFSGPFLHAVSPVVSVVSSGDESARKEYIHPRSTLVGALGKHSRVAEPLIFVTELVAFFEVEGWTDPEDHMLKDGNLVALEKTKGPFFAFRRAAFGIVKVRTDGERLLVYTNSGQKDLKEAYAFRMDPPAAVGGPDQVVAIPVVNI